MRRGIQENLMYLYPIHSKNDIYPLTFQNDVVDIEDLPD
jgi:hypothetical protein